MNSRKKETNISGEKESEINEDTKKMTQGNKTKAETTKECESIRKEEKEKNIKHESKKRNEGKILKKKCENYEESRR